MRTVYYTFLLMITAALLWGCTPRPSQQSETLLCAADSLMENHPDSALAMLNTLTSADFPNPEQKARFALLKSQAMDKSYIDVSDDSLIALADSYYSDHPSADPSLRIRAAFYRGRVFFNAKDYPTAIGHFLRSKKFASEVDSLFWVGRNYSEITDIYTISYHYTAALAYADSTLEVYKHFSRSTFFHYAIFSKANVYQASQNFHKAKELYEQILDTAKFYNNIELENGVITYLALSCLYDKDIHRTLDLLLPIFKEGLSTPYQQILIGNAYFRLGDIHRAKMFLPESVDSTDAKELLLRYEIAQKEDNPRKALVYLRALMLLNNNELSTSLDHDYAKVVADFHSKEEQLQALEHKGTLAKIGIVTTMALLILLWIIRGFIRKNRRANVQIDKQMESIRELRDTLGSSLSQNSSLKKSLEGKDSEITLLNKEMQANLNSRFSILDNLLITYYENQNNRNLKLRITSEIDKVISDFSDDPQTFDKLVALINSTYDNVYDHMIADFPHIKEVDRKIFVYSLLGFSTSTIALFLKVEDSTYVYSHRSRLRLRLIRSSSNYVSQYSELLAQ